MLPPAARPRHKLWIMTYTWEGAPGVLYITPSGLVHAWGNTPGAAQAYTSLAGIAYPLGS